MVQITIIRHAQSEANINPKLPPELTINSRLSRRGILQAMDLNFTFDLLILSPLKRTMETYVHSNIAIGGVLVSDLFRELIDCPANILELEEFKEESMSCLGERVDKAILLLRELGKKYSNIGIISHYQFIKLIRQKLNLPEASLANCSHNTFELV